MALSTATSVQLPTGRTTMVIFPGGNTDYQGNWPAAAAALQTLWNTGGATGHVWGGLHAIMGSSWSSGSYYNSRTMWQGFPGQPFVSLPSMFPQFDPSDGNLITAGTGAVAGSVATYDKALAGAYDYYYNQVFAQLAADWPYAVLRVGQEVDGNWFWWGLYAAGNGATPAKVSALHTKLSRMARAKGFLGYYVINCGNFNNVNIRDVVPTDPRDYDIADCDCYATGNAGSGGSATNQSAAWLQAQLPMISNTMAVAKRDGKRWGMFETSPNVWRYPVNGSSDNGCHDDPLFLQNLRGVLLDPANPECAYLTLHNGSDYGTDGNRSTITRRDTLWITSTITGTDWHDDSTAPNSLAEFRSDRWTVAGLTRAGGTSTPARGGLVQPGGRGRTTRRVAAR